MRRIPLAVLLVIGLGLPAACGSGSATGSTSPSAHPRAAAAARTSMRPRPGAPSPTKASPPAKASPPPPNLAWLGGGGSGPPVPDPPPLPPARPLVARTDPEGGVYGGYAHVSIQGVWQGQFTVDVTDLRVTCLATGDRVQWLFGTGLIGQSPSPTDDGVSVRIEEIHDRVDDPARVTGRAVDLSLRDRSGAEFDGEGSEPDPNYPTPVRMRVSDDHRRVAVSTVMFVRPSFSFTDTRFGWVAVTATVSCDGRPPPPPS